MNIGDIFFNFRGDGSGLNVDAKKAAEAAGVAGGQSFAAKFSASMKAGIGIGAGIGAFGAITAVAGKVTDALGDMVRNAISDEESVNRLAASLKANVSAWDGNTAAIEANILAKQRLGFDDETLRDSLSVLVGATHDVTKAQEIQNVAMDLARFKKIDLKTASEALIKVEGGVYRSLKQLGIKLKDNATSTEALAAVQAVASGQAEAYATTTAGTMESANIALAEVGETIGKELLPVVLQLARAARDDLVPAITDVFGAAGHLNWAMEQQRKNDKDLMFWQRGLLGLWTDSAQGADAYAASLEETARQQDLARRSAAGDQMAMQALGDTYAEVRATLREVGSAAGDAAGGVGDLAAAEKDAAKEADTLRTAAGKLWDELIEGTKIPQPDLEDKLELRSLPLKIRVAKDEVKAAQRELEKARTTEQKNAAALRLQEAKNEVVTLTADLKALRGKFAEAGKGLGYSLGSTLHAEVVRWNLLTRRELEALGDIGVNRPPAGTNTNPDIRASGGPVRAGMPYIVGERRPELFVPNVNGTIVPQVPGGSGGSMAREQQINIEHVEIRDAHDEFSLIQSLRFLAAVG